MDTAKKMKPKLLKKDGLFKPSLLAGGIAAAIMLFVYLVQEFWPVGDSVILRMDLYHQYAPLFAELYERILGGDSLIYSFTSGLGSGFLGNIFNYLSSPTLFFIFIFGHKRIAYAIASMILVKAGVSAFTFTYFLNRIRGKKDYSAAAFGILYAFCGYFVAYYWNVMWLDAMSLFPLVMLGIYLIIHEEKPLTYIISLAAIMFTNYYMAFMVCMLSVILFLYFYFSEYSIGTSSNPDAILKKKYKYSIAPFFFKSRFLRVGVMFAFSSILAACISAVSLLPVYFVLKASSATNSSFPSEFSTYFTFFDFIANHLAGVEPTIRSSGDTVYPNVYCGIATLILVPLYFFNNRFDLRKKIAAVCVIGIFFFSFNINYLNFIWHGFHFPNDLPYRFSFAYSFFLLYIAYQTFKEIKGVSAKSILACAIGVSVFAIAAEKIGSANVDLTVIWTSIVLAVVYAILFALGNNKHFAKSSVVILLVAASIAEILIADTRNYQITQTQEAYTKSYDDTATVVDYIKSQDSEDDGFYRMELASLLTRMDNCWFYYNGVSTFTSMAYEKLSELQRNLGMYGNRINSYTYNPQTGLYNSMMSLKYIVDNHTYVATDNYVPRLNDNFLYERYYGYNNMNVYKNKYWLPVAFGVSAEMASDWNTDALSPFEIQNDFYRLASGVSDILVPIKGAVTEAYGVNSVTDETLNSGYFTITKSGDAASEGSLTVEFENPKQQNVYLYVAGYDVQSAYVTADDFSYTQTVTSDPYVLDLGRINQGTVVKAVITLKDDSPSATTNVYCVGMDQEKFVNAYNAILSNGTIEVTENKESRLKGTINLAEGKILYTSIPYDPSWSVIVDGNEIESEDIIPIGDALMGVRMNAGQHEIEFRYHPQGLRFGACVSLVGLVLLVLLIICSRKKLLFASDSFRYDYLELHKWRYNESDFENQDGLEFDEIFGAITPPDDGAPTENDGATDAASAWDEAMQKAKAYAEQANINEENADAVVAEFNQKASDALSDDSSETKD